MEAQWVFGNPQTRKKVARGLAGSKKGAHTVQKRSGKKSMAKKRTARKKNPYRYIFEGKTKKGKPTLRKGRIFHMEADAARATSELAKLADKKDVQSRIKAKKLRAILADVKKGSSRRSALKEKKRLEAKGYKSEALKDFRDASKGTRSHLVSVRGETVAKKKGKGKKKSKKSAKRKAKRVKKKVVRKAKKKKVAKKKTAKRTKKKVAKRKSRGLGYKAKVLSLGDAGIAIKRARRYKKKRKLAKGKKVSIKVKGHKIEMVRKNPRRKIKRRKNPFGGTMSKLEKLLAHSTQEALGLVAGGATFGAINGLATKIPVVKEIQKKLVKIPVIGNSLVPMLAGAALNAIGEKKGIKALRVAGKGLIGAAAVNIGVQASQLVPMLKAAPMAGIPEGMGEDDLFEAGDYGEQSPDYGAVVMEGADYGKVEYFPEDDIAGIPAGMSGIPAGMSGEDDEEMGVVEFFPESVG